MTGAGQNVKYLDNVSTPIAKMIATKIILNITLSNQDSKSMTLDIKDMNLQIVLDLSECMKIPYNIIFDNIKKIQLGSNCAY